MSVCTNLQQLSEKLAHISVTPAMYATGGHVARSFAGALASAPDLSRPSRPQSLGGVCGERSLGGV